MSESEEAKILKPELSIRKKLGNIKFDQAFDESIINRAEKAVAKYEPEFKAESLSDYHQLKALFQTVTEANLNKDLYHQIFQLAYSIKSRAGNGGMLLASQIANSMYKYAEAAPSNGYKVLKLHFDALEQVFEHNYAANDEATARKLVSGLEELSTKSLKP